ncbi:hypothetical protein GCM10010326_65170 [Streptomyces xanthochromogenes]|uniref:Uncharacterized protein n=1 Tax=Streptomyces xanthochromogenes TaxID=67384 RepID=A0ABQ3AMF6_9ACTN|nr:hypothetical protein GCM10010326_65170 [Streptomyces xanthochromogenes]
MAAGMRLALTEEERVNFARPAADPLFESVAQEYGPGVVAYVLWEPMVMCPGV